MAKFFLARTILSDTLKNFEGYGIKNNQEIIVKINNMYFFNKYNDFDILVRFPEINFIDELLYNEREYFSFRDSDIKIKLLKQICPEEIKNYKYTKLKPIHDKVFDYFFKLPF